MPSKFNCAPKFDQKVKVPSRDTIRSVCQDLFPLVSNQFFIVKDLINVLADFVAKRFSVNVLHSQAIQVDPGDINLAAYYDSIDDESCKIPIELVLITNSQDSIILVTDELLNIFVTRLADCLIHELVHMKQARDREFIETRREERHRDNLDDEIDYLSHPDEIDAYAYNIADELSENSEPLKILATPTAVKIDQSLNLWVYVNTFGQCPNDPIMKKLLKKVYKRLT